MEKNLIPFIHVIAPGGWRVSNSRFPFEYIEKAIITLVSMSEKSMEDRWYLKYDQRNSHDMQSLTVLLS